MIWLTSDAGLEKLSERYFELRDLTSDKLNSYKYRSLMLDIAPSLLLSFLLGFQWKQLGLNPQMTKTEGKCITLFIYKLRVENL